MFRGIPHSNFRTPPGFGLAVLVVLVVLVVLLVQEGQPSLGVLLAHVTRQHQLHLADLMGLAALEGQL